MAENDTGFGPDLSDEELISPKKSWMRKMKRSIATPMGRIMDGLRQLRARKDQNQGMVWVDKLLKVR